MNFRFENVSELIQKNQDSIEQFIREVIKVRTDIDLSLLESIIITKDISKQLKDLSLRSGLSFGLTDRSDVTVMGKCIRIAVNPARFLILFNQAVFAPLFENTVEAQRFSAHLIAHELSHIHDMTKRLALESKINAIPKGTQVIFLSLADTLWGEYFACRNSFANAPTNYDCSLDIYLKAMTRYSEEVEKLKKQALVERDWPLFAEESRRLHSFTLAVFGRFWDDIAALRNNIPEEVRVLKARLPSPFLILSRYLDRSYRSYPWATEKETLTISKFIERIYHSTSVYLEDREGNPCIFIR